MTLDIDRHSANENIVMMKYLKLRELTGVTPEVRISSRGHGLQFICRGVQCSYDYSLEIRRICGEDKKRLEFDETLNYKPKQILWREKKAKGKTRQIEPLDEKHIFSLPIWMSQLPRSYWLRRLK